MSPKESVKNERVISKVKECVKKEGVRGFARSSGLSPAIITRYVQGKVGEPSQTTLDKLAVYFGVSVAWLRGDASDYAGGGDGENFNSLPNDDLAAEIIQEVDNCIRKIGIPLSGKAKMELYLEFYKKFRTGSTVDTKMIEEKIEEAIKYLQ